MNTRIIFLAVAVLASGCAAQPAPDRFDVLSHRDPADPERETGSDPYHSVVAGYHPRSVVEPKPWSDTAVQAEKPEGNKQ